MLRLNLSVACIIAVEIDSAIAHVFEEFPVHAARAPTDHRSLRTEKDPSSFLLDSFNQNGGGWFDINISYVLRQQLCLFLERNS